MTIEHAIVLEHGLQAASTATAIARATLVEAALESHVVRRTVLEVHGFVRTLILFSIKTHWQHLLRFPTSPLLPADSARHHVCDPCIPKELIDLLYMSAATLGQEMVTGAEREHLCKILVFFINKFDEKFTIQQDGLAVSLKMLFVQLIDRLRKRLPRLGKLVPTATARINGICKKLVETRELFTKDTVDGDDDEMNEEEMNDFTTDFIISPRS